MKSEEYGRNLKIKGDGEERKGRRQEWRKEERMKGRKCEIGKKEGRGRNRKIEERGWHEWTEARVMEK